MQTHRAIGLLLVQTIKAENNTTKRKAPMKTTKCIIFLTIIAIGSFFSEKGYADMESPKTPMEMKERSIFILDGFIEGEATEVIRQSVKSGNDFVSTDHRARFVIDRVVDGNIEKSQSVIIAYMTTNDFRYRGGMARPLRKGEKFRFFVEEGSFKKENGSIVVRIGSNNSVCSEMYGKTIQEMEQEDAKNPLGTVEERTAKARRALVDLSGSDLKKSAEAEDELRALDRFGKSVLRVDFRIYEPIIKEVKGDFNSKFVRYLFERNPQSAVMLLSKQDISDESFEKVKSEANRDYRNNITTAHQVAEYFLSRSEWWAKLFAIEIVGENPRFFEKDIDDLIAKLEKDKRPIVHERVVQLKKDWGGRKKMFKMEEKRK